MVGITAAGNLDLTMKHMPTWLFWVSEHGLGYDPTEPHSENIQLRKHFESLMWFPHICHLSFLNCIIVLSYILVPFSQCHAASEMSCSSSMETASNALEVGQAFELTCWVAYSGDGGWAPVIEWTGPSGIITDAMDETSDSTVRASVRRVADFSLSGAVYSARMHFTDYDGCLLPNSASNVPSYTSTYTFSPIIVQGIIELDFEGIC